jgi:hypothetical protein
VSIKIHIYFFWGGGGSSIMEKHIRVLRDTASVSSYNDTQSFLRNNKSLDLLLSCCFSCLPFCDRLHFDLWNPFMWASLFLLNVVTRGIECQLTLYAGQQTTIFRSISYNEIKKASLMFGILITIPFLKLISRPNFRKSWRHSVWKYCRKVEFISMETWTAFW